MESLKLCVGKKIIHELPREKANIDYANLCRTLVNQCISYDWLQNPKDEDKRWLKDPTKTNDFNFLYFKDRNAAEGALLSWNYLLKQQEKEAS